MQFNLVIVSPLADFSHVGLYNLLTVICDPQMQGTSVRCLYTRTAHSFGMTL